MATIIENEPVRERVVRVERPTTDSSGWAIAVIILIIVIVGGIWAYAHYHRAAAPAASGGTNINVTVPSTTGSDTSGTPPSTGTSY